MRSHVRTSRLLALSLTGGVLLATPGCGDGAAAPGQASGGPAGRAEPASGQEPGAREVASAPAPAPAPADGPKIAFETLEHDFGRVDDTSSLQCSFPFTNAGSAELVVEEVKASCGCTATELDRDRFAAGDADEIRIDWEPKGFGRQSKTVTVKSNSPLDPYVTLTIRADIQPLLRIEPISGQFGPVEAGRKHSVRLTATSDDETIEILGAKSTNPNLDVRILRGVDLGEPDVAAYVDLTISERAPRGAFHGSAILTISGTSFTTGQPTVYEMTVPTKATLHGKIVPEPAAFYVGRVLPGASADYKVHVTRPNQEPFRVVRAELTGCPVAGFRVDAVPTADGGYDLVLSGPAGAYEGPIRGRVVVETDIPGDEPLSMPVMGIVGPAPAK